MAANRPGENGSVSACLAVMPNSNMASSWCVCMVCGVWCVWCVVCVVCGVWCVCVSACVCLREREVGKTAISVRAMIFIGWTSNTHEYY